MSARRRNPSASATNYVPLIWGGAIALVAFTVYGAYAAYKNSPPPTACANLGEEGATEVGGALLGTSLAASGENADYAPYGLLGTAAAGINTLLFGLPAALGAYLAGAVSSCSPPAPAACPNANTGASGYYGCCCCS